MRKNPTAASPPRLLLGASLLFWGGVTGHPLVGLLCAFIVEARWWVELRWVTSERGFVRSWHLSLVLLVLASAWLWLVGESVLRLFELLMWMPVLFLPVILAQQYSTSATMLLNTFSFVARRKMLADRAAGRVGDPIRVHVGYAYFCVVLLSSALRKPDEVVSFVGMVILSVVALYCSSPLGRRRPYSWGAAVLCVVGISFCGVLAMRFLFALLSEGGLGLIGSDGVGNEAHTGIGSIGKIKQSYRIRWRVSGAEARPFTLIRTASFNRYASGIWSHRQRTGISRDLDYVDMILGGEETEKIWAFRREDLVEGEEFGTSLRIRGEATTRTALPMPETARILRALAVQGVEWNPLGTVVAENPDHSVIDYEIVSGDRNLIESPPDDVLDLHVPDSESKPFQGSAEVEGFEGFEGLQKLKPLDGLARTCEKLGLRDLPDEEKVEVLRAFFRENFNYTLDLKGDEVRAVRAISRFIEVTREGHCEYFGSAAALLLREAGVPTRYCEGFSAQERDLKRDEWLLRGRHAHAWCRAYLGGKRELTVLPDGSKSIVWSGGKWVDVDLTPPASPGTEESGIPWQRVFLDFIQRAREDFLLWRTRPGNRQLVDLIMATIAVLLVAYVLARVWKTRTKRRKVEIAGFRGPAGDVPVTPLHGLEAIAEPWLGHRPAGVALTRWLWPLADMIPEARDPLLRAMGLHWKARFDPRGAGESDRQELEHLCRGLRKRLKVGKRHKAPDAEA